MLLRLLSAAVFLVGLVPVLHAAEQAVRKVYPVGDLVIPIADGPPADAGQPGVCCTRGACAPKTCEDELIQLIQSAVAPGTWQSAGGGGTVEYFPVGMSLVVRQSAEIQEQVAKLLGSLRKLQENEIVFEVRFLQVTDTFQERVGVDFEVNVGGNGVKPARLELRQDGALAQHLVTAARWHPQHAVLLGDKELARLMETVQADPGASVMQSPKITTFDGQRACVTVGDTRVFLTDLKEGKTDGQTVYTPINTTEFIGTKLTLQGTATPDRKHVCVHVRAALSTLDEVVPLVPVTTTVRPAAADGSKPELVQATHYIQKPQVRRLAVEKTLAMPDGGTALVDCGKFVLTERTELGPPVLSKVPYLNRLFKNVGYGQTEKRLLMLVTARLLRVDEACEAGTFGSAAGTLVGSGKCQASSGPGCAMLCQGVVVANERNFHVTQTGDEKCCAAKDCSKCSKCSKGEPAGCCKGSFPLSEVVQLAQAGVSDDLIINQILTTGSCYTLDARSILWLKGHGVSDAVIIQMQGTRPRADAPATSGEAANSLMLAPVPAQSAAEACPGSFGMATDFLTWPIGPTAGCAPDPFNVVADLLTWPIGILPPLPRLVNVYSSDPQERVELLLQSDGVRVIPDKPRRNPPAKPGAVDRLRGSIGP